jgi:WD40 repeat protein
MSMVKFSCPKCPTTLAVPAPIAPEQIVQCPRCGAQFRLNSKRPAATAAPAAAVSRPPLPRAVARPIIEPADGALSSTPIGTSQRKLRAVLGVAACLVLGLVAVIVLLVARSGDGSSRPTAKGGVVEAQNSYERLAAVAQVAETHDEPDSPEATVVRASDDSEPAPAPQGKPLLVLDAAGHSAVVKRAFFSADGSQVVTVSMDKTIRVWDVAEGEPVRTLRLPIGLGDEGALHAAALSADAKRLAVTGVPVGRGKLGMLIHVLALESGKVETVLKRHENIIAALAWSPDDRRLASASYDGTARIYDVAGGQTERTLQGHKGPVKAVAFSPDGRRIATVSEDQTGRIWAADTGNCEAELRGHANHVESVAWHPTDGTLATGSVDATIRLWGPDGRAIRTYPARPDEMLQIASLSFSHDGRELLYAGVGFAGGAGLLDVASGRRRVDFKRHTNTVMHGQFSPDGNLAVTTGGNNHETLIWSTRDGSVVQRLMGKGRTIWAVGWSADGKSLAWSNTNRGDPWKANFPLERSFNLEELAWGPKPGNDFRRARLTSGEISLEAADLLKVNIKRAGQPTQVFQSPVAGERIYSFTLLDDDHAVMGGAYSIYLVELRTNKIVREYVGHSGMVLAVSPSPDGRYFATGSTDQTLCVWDTARETPLLSLFVADTEWIVWTPEGYYAASANGERLMGWQINRGPNALAEFHPAARFRKSLYHPEVIAQLLREGSLERALAKAGKEQQAEIAPVTVEQVLPPEVAILAPHSDRPVEVKEASLKVQAAARSQGKHPVTALRLLVDGRPYQGQGGTRRVARPQFGVVRASWTVELTPGPHVLAVQAESAVSRAVSDAVEVVYQASQPADAPRLFLLAAGVSAYPGRARLRYAASDAEDIARVFRNETGQAFQKVEVKLLTDHQATRAGILQGLDWLSKRMTPQDVAVIFLSGHGTRDRRGEFYFVPIDANPGEIAASCVSGTELKKRLEAMPGRLIAMFDACHSGAAAEGLAGGVAVADDLVRDLVTEDYGVIVMCSSLGREYSIESSAVKHGYFTLAVVEGLSGEADLNHDRVVHFSELDAYAGPRVRELSEGTQNPVTAKPPTIRSFPLAKH